MRTASEQPGWRLPVEALIGPLAHGKRRPLFAVLLLVAVAVLTLVTQIGGGILWLALPVIDRAACRARRWGRTAAFGAGVAVFAAAYGVAAIAVVPSVAAAFGRVPLPCFGTGGSLTRAALLSHGGSQHNHLVSLPIWWRVGCFSEQQRGQVAAHEQIDLKQAKH